MRSLTALAEKPPNTTECTAPMRAQACMAITASGIKRHVNDHAVAAPNAGML